MAVRIIRQANRIALLGAPTSAAALRPGHERAPEALRSAGLIQRLEVAGFEVRDVGDDPQQLYQPDEESPRARNIPRVVAALEALRSRVEMAVKSGALPLVLSGDCTVALATVAGVRRYYRNVGMVYMDRDADLNVPATSPSGCIDGMVVSHLAGRGAAELVRFWSEPPLVREPSIALFGVDRLDPPEEEVLRRAPIQYFPASRVQQMGVSAAAETALERIHGTRQEFVLHFDVDVIAGEDFSATDLPAAGGMRLEEVRKALGIFAKQPHLIAMEVAAYNPERDANGVGAKIIVDLVASTLAARLEALKTAASTTAAASETVAAVQGSPPAVAPADEPAPSPQPANESKSEGA